MFDEEDELCFSFESLNPEGAQGGGKRESDSYAPFPRGGRGGRGRPRGPRRGRERGENGGGESSPPLCRYSSGDSLNRGRGGRDDHNFRGWGRRGGRPPRTGTGESSYDPSGGSRNLREGDRGRGEMRGGRGEGERRGGRRGGGRGFRGGDNHRGRGLRPFPIRVIAAIEDMDDATMRLNSQIEDFEIFMKQDVMTQDDTVKTLKVLHKVLQNDLQRGVVLKILQIVCTSRFLDSHLTSLINLSFCAQEGLVHNVSELEEIVETIREILSQICCKMPSYSSKGVLLLTALLNTSPEVIQLLERHSSALVEGMRELLKECQECLRNFQASGEGKGARPRERRGPNEDDDIPPEDFASLPIFPAPQDMDWNDRIFLRANKEVGSYRDVNHYLDVQFRLLREDYIRPLRTGIREFKRCRDRGEDFKKNQDLRLYPKTRLLSMVCKDSLEHRVQFEMTPRLERVRWQSSKRLLYGSLVCLTLDDFDTIFFAVVTDRNVKDLEKGIIQIRFENDVEEVLELTSKDVFTMAETTAYFEAYRHVLEGLREMKDSLPMARYLVECNSTIKPPRYLLTGDTMGKMNLNALLKDDDDRTFDASSVVVINPQRWPSVDQTTLNESQMAAVQTALSKELAIIQGPPGTGKTYVGLKVAKVLLENRQVWTDPDQGQRPILVVCYTNHALDQFLEGILAFCPQGIVRVGSRCKNPELEDFSLKNIRRRVREDKKTSKSVHFSIKDCSRKLADLKLNIDSVSSKLEATTKGVVSVAVLKPHIPPRQYESLMKMDLYAAPSRKNQAEVLLEWLSKGAITQKVSDDEDPYSMLAAEVTSKILQGGDMCPESLVDVRDIHSLPATLRAQLYRFWLDKMKTLLQEDAALAASKGQSGQGSLKWLDTSKRDILPDYILKRVVSRQFFSAITQPLMERHSRNAQFCVRAWLGLSGEEPTEATERIIHGQVVCREAQFHPKQIVFVPRKTRIYLYRFWRREVIRVLEVFQQREPNSKKHKQALARAHKDILHDDVLKLAVSPNHLQAIKTEMMRRHRRQADYFIRAWLGVDEFCQSAVLLEGVLDQLDEENDVSQEGEGELNIEEEADVIQNSRQLDLDDDDDLFNFSKKKPSVDVQSAMKELGVLSTTASSLAASSADDEGFSVPKYHQKKQLKKIKSLMTSSRAMTQEEAEGVINLWSEQLSVEDRARLYLFWLQIYQDSLRQSVKQQAQAYSQSAQELRELRMGEDKDILEEATIIGMTTTGAARYRRVLNGVACPIVILEEAAEVLEAHVVTTLHKACQHLILIGDHQQLRPSPTVYELTLHYKLDLSLFERLINNHLPHSTLAVQHRMRPEVANLVRHVYPALEDHGTTRGRPHIRGVKQDVFFFHHEVEETRNDETSSKSNQHEAELVVRLCRYLLQQGYPPDTLTILTAYSGQVFALKTIMKKDQDLYQGVRVTAVDNYQGEENDVILLSLVRSNQQGTVGFLGSDNRVCVALSRARNGFFAFGNFRILAESSTLWTKICRTAKDNGQLGDTLVLRCENHHSRETVVAEAKDFDQMPEGGCKLPCGTRLSCGHVCELSCHGYDRDHQKYMCRKKCERVNCKLGHPCPKKCFEECGKCVHKVTKTVPMCGHQADMECHRDPHTWHCQDRCKSTLGCGHQCTGVCGKCRLKNSHDVQCTVMVDRMWPCGHLVQSQCHVIPGELPCDNPCGATLSCGHPCSGTCGQCWAGRVHVTCTAKCRHTLPGCGHKCPLPCGTICLPCTKKCSTGCTHSSCNKACGIPCQVCKEGCPWKICKHQRCESLCDNPCPPCPKPCPRKRLPCSSEDYAHHCWGLCGEKCFCFPCEREKFFCPLAIEGVESKEESLVVVQGQELIKLPICGHIFKAKLLDVYVKKKVESLPAGESVVCPEVSCKKKIVVCPEVSCKKKIQDKHCWRYHHLFQERHERFQEIKRNLIQETTVPQSRRQKLQDSLALLTHKAEEHKSFASKANRGQLFKNETTLNVNRALALTHQIKMTKVFETASAELEHFCRTYGTRREIKHTADVLQKLLFKPTSHMTSQRIQELTAATRRFAYMTKLFLATKHTNNDDLIEQIESALKMLLTTTTGAGDLMEAERVLEECQKANIYMWTYRTEFIDVSILDEPPEMDLCDIVKPMRRRRSIDSLPSSSLSQSATSLLQTTFYTPSASEAKTLVPSKRVAFPKQLSFPQRMAPPKPEPTNVPASELPESESRAFGAASELEQVSTSSAAGTSARPVESSEGETSSQSRSEGMLSKLLHFLTK